MSKETKNKSDGSLNRYLRGEKAGKPVIIIDEEPEEIAFRAKKVNRLHEIAAGFVTFKPVEKALKKVFLEEAEKNNYFLETGEEKEELLKKTGTAYAPLLRKQLSSENQKEISFFPEDLDVFIEQYPRYLPGIWHIHDFYEIVCVFWGHCTHYIMDETLEMEAGDICILAPGTRHAITAFNDDVVILNIDLRRSTFESSFFGIFEKNDILEQFFRHTLYHSAAGPYMLFHTGNSYDFELYDQILYASEELQSNHSYRRTMVNNIITSFFVNLLRRHSTEVVISDTAMREKDENAIYILQYIQAHYTDVTLHELAVFFNYSERQIQRIIKNITGKTYRQNIADIKMHQAAKLLRMTDKTVLQICEELGFSDPGNFRTIFKRYYGSTPALYREKGQSSVSIPEF